MMIPATSDVKPLASSFKKILIKPFLPKELNFVKAAYKSVYGKIKIEMEIDLDIDAEIKEIKQMMVDSEDKTPSQNPFQTKTPKQKRKYNKRKMA